MTTTINWHAASKRGSVRNNIGKEYYGIRNWNGLPRGRILTYDSYLCISMIKSMFVETVHNMEGNDTHSHIVFMTERKYGKHYDDQRGK